MVGSANHGPIGPSQPDGEKMHSSFAPSTAMHVMACSSLALGVENAYSSSPPPYAAVTSAAVLAVCSSSISPKEVEEEETNHWEERMADRSNEKTPECPPPRALPEYT